jgi:hypothetical protein
MVKSTAFPSSPVEGVYVGVVEVALLIVPFPLWVHSMVPLEAVAPATVAEPLIQMSWLPPAVAVGRGFTVIVLVVLTGLHGPVPSGSVVVRVRTTDPEKPGAGVKVTVSGLAVGEPVLNVPDPEVIVQDAWVACVNPAPDKTMGEGIICWQTTSGPPAVTVADGLMVITI